MSIYACGRILVSVVCWSGQCDAVAMVEEVNVDVAIGSPCHWRARATSRASVEPGGSPLSGLLPPLRRYRTTSTQLPYRFAAPPVPGTAGAGSCRYKLKLSDRK